jgi:hypothetical protein
VRRDTSGRIWQENVSPWTIVKVSISFRCTQQLVKDACRDNEEYKECGLTCPPTCQAPVPSCANNCCGKGCFCKEGYILEDVSQECVAADQCPV